MPTDVELTRSRDVSGTSPLPLREEEGKNGLLDLLLVLAARKWSILGVTLLGGTIAVIALLVRPPTYTATSVIIPPQQQQSSAAAILGQLGAAAAMSRTDLLRTPADLYIGILKSRSIADNLVARFGLSRLYRARTLVDARKNLEDQVRFQTAKDGLIRIIVEDRDPKRAAVIANGYVDELQRLNSRLALTDSAQRRLFFERQMEAEKDELSRAETNLKTLQEKSGLLHVASQTEAMIRSIAQIEAEISGRRVILQRLKAGATEQNSEVVRMEAELKALAAELSRLEASGARSRPGNPVIPTSNIPAAGLEYLRRLRELKYHETLLELLGKQYEVAKIDEARQAPLIQVVDLAVPPDKRSGPSRKILVLLAVLSSALLGCSIAVAERSLADPVRTEKLRSLLRVLFTLRGR
jgi:tyrosine-protein kinase Etk/Wzc